MGQPTGSQWLIQGTELHKDNQSQSLKHNGTHKNNHATQLQLGNIMDPMYYNALNHKIHGTVHVIEMRYFCTGNFVFTGDGWIGTMATFGFQRVFTENKERELRFWNDVTDLLRQGPWLLAVVNTIYVINIVTRK